MAEIQDLDSSDGIGELEFVENQINDEPKSIVSEVLELPSKYKGKSVGEVVRMHQEAEKLIERQGREVGEVRKLADELIKSQLTPRQEVEMPHEVDFFENPQEAIRQQIENHPRVQAAEQFAKQSQMAQARQRIEQMHPDINQIVQNDEFQTWVNSSRVRQQMFKEADAYNLDMANELVSTFKELRTVKQQKIANVDNTLRDNSLRAASVETGGSGESSKKVYRRADLILLKMNDPRRYEAMSDEIMAAYQTGRVK